MGKKRRMIAHPQKFGRKFAAHPVARPVSETSAAATPTPVVIEETQATPDAEEKIEVVTPSAEASVSTAAPKKPTKSTTKKSSIKKKSSWSRKKDR